MLVWLQIKQKTRFVGRFYDNNAVGAYLLAHPVYVFKTLDNFQVGLI